MTIYRVYLRDANQRVAEKTTTGNREAALAAFRALVDMTRLDGQKVMACLSFGGRPIAYHRFDIGQGPIRDPMYYWRGRVNEIPWPPG